MAKQRKYYGLITFDRETSMFTWTFGSYDKSDVVFEKQDMHDHGYKLKDMQIITYDQCPTQGIIDQQISELNRILLSHS